MKTTTQKTIDRGKPNDHLPEALHANQMLNGRVLNQARYQQLIDLKEERSDKERNLRNMLFTLSMCISLLLVVTAINWRFYDNQSIVDLGTVADDFDEITEIPISTQPPPPPPKLKLENVAIVEVEDEEIVEEIEINLDVEVSQDEAIDDVVYEDMPMEMEEEEADEIFQIVQNQPEPVGGLAAFYQYVADELNYPVAASRLNVTGVVYVRFVVEKDGRITDVQVIKGIGAGCDEEAIRVIESAPAWIPGKQRGRPVRVYMTVPIRFILRER